MAGLSSGTMADEVVEGDDAVVPPKPKRQKTTRPDFTSEARFEKLISLFAEDTESDHEVECSARSTWSPA